MTPADQRAPELRLPEMTVGAERILGVASELFYRRGIHAVGVDTIAAESGITKRTLYDRFGSKDNLVVAYLQARHEAWWTRLEQRLATAPAPRVLCVFDAYVHDPLPSERGCPFLNAAGELPSDHPAHRVVRAHKEAVRQRLVELVRDDRPDLDDPEEAADHVFLLLEGAVTHRGIDQGDRLLSAARGMAAELLEDPGDPDRLRGTGGGSAELDEEHADDDEADAGEHTSGEGLVPDHPGEEGDRHDAESRPETVGDPDGNPGS